MLISIIEQEEEVSELLEEKKEEMSIMDTLEQNIKTKRSQAAGEYGLWDSTIKPSFLENEHNNYLNINIQHSSRPHNHQIKQIGVRQTDNNSQHNIYIQNKESLDILIEKQIAITPPSFSSDIEIENGFMTERNTIRKVDVSEIIPCYLLRQQLSNDNIRTNTQIGKIPDIPNLNPLECKEGGMEKEIFEEDLELKFSEKENIFAESKIMFPTIEIEDSFLLEFIRERQNEEDVNNNGGDIL